MDFLLRRIKSVRGRRLKAEPCAICGWNGSMDYLLQRSASIYDDDDEDLDYSGQSSTDNFSWSPPGSPDCISCELRLKLATHVVRDDLLVYSTVRNPDPGKFQVSALDAPPIEFSVFVPGEHDELAINPLRRPLLALNTENQTSFRFARAKLEDCLAHHEDCPKPSLRFLPSRLLCVKPINDDGDLALCIREVVPAGSRYTALSYCWGDAVTCRTTNYNYKAQLMGIDWASLPSTFRHAILFTRELKVNYIWIDALCIIQNDAYDWAVEAGMMHNIYHNAYVTLAGLHGKNPERGLYSFIHPDHQFKVMEFRLGLRKYEIYARQLRGLLGGELHRDASSSPPAGSEPLLERAWALQERLTSPRTIYFTPNELAWECCTNAACQCQGETLSADGDDDVGGAGGGSEARGRGGIGRSGGTQARNMTTATTSKALFRASGLGRGPYADWHYIVRKYMARKMARPSDRLVGLGAIACHCAAARAGQSYLAGLWSGTFVQDLTWRSLRSGLVRDIAMAPGPLQQHSAPKYSAPTWSWASVDGRVEYDALWTATTVAAAARRSSGNNSNNNAAAAGGSSNCNSTPLAHVVRVQVEYLHSNRFGVALSGMMQLRAHVLHCYVGPMRHMQEVDAHVQVGGWPLAAEICLDPRPQDWDRVLEDGETGGYMFLRVYLVLLGTTTGPVAAAVAEGAPAGVTDGEGGGRRALGAAAVANRSVPCAPRSVTALLVCRRDDAVDNGVFKRLGFVGIQDARKLESVVRDPLSRRVITVV